MDDPVSMHDNLQMAEMNPRLLLNGETPRLIDEWQLAPKLWDSVRFEVDHRRQVSQFILTGSAVPANEKDIYHSGTGRFSWLIMRPMSLYKSGESNGLECDAVVHLNNGKFGLVEIKLGGETLVNDGAKSLKELASKINTDKMGAPSFLMVLTGVGKYAYKRTDGVLVVPIGCLKD